MILLLKKEKADEHKKHFRKRGGASPLTSNSKNFGHSIKGRDYFRDHSGAGGESVVEKIISAFYKNKAFTLAEVLITLGIIGVVAALTIPTLISKIQEMHFHAKWKECYAILNSSFKMVAANNPRLIVSNAGVNAMSREFIDLLLENMNVIETCAASGDYDTNKCDNYSNWRESDIRNKWSAVSYNSTELRYKSLAGGTLNSYDVMNKAALLKNGAAVYFGSMHSGLTILVDVNNFQGGPNILGKDVYAISLMKGSSQQNNVYIEELGFAPFGAAGTRCMDEEAPCSLAEPSEGFGIWGCSENIGMKDANYIVQASGAGCSYKYLHEK